MLVLNQSLEIDKATSKLSKKQSNNMAYFITCFKIKCTPVRYRETTQQHFAKRGMSWNGLVVLFRIADYYSTEADGRNREREEFDHMYFDQMSPGDKTQDYFMGFPGLNLCLLRFTKNRCISRKLLYIQKML